MIGFFRFVLVVLLLTVVAMTSAIVTMHFAIHGGEVSIPDLRGMTAADAGQRAASLGLSLQVENRLYSADVPLGRVANQSPLAGKVGDPRRAGVQRLSAVRRHLRQVGSDDHGRHEAVPGRSEAGFHGQDDH